MAAFELGNRLQVAGWMDPCCAAVPAECIQSDVQAHRSVAWAGLRLIGCVHPPLLHTTSKGCCYAWHAVGAVEHLMTAHGRPRWAGLLGDLSLTGSKVAGVISAHAIMRMYATEFCPGLVGAQASVSG